MEATDIAKEQYGIEPDLYVDCTGYGLPVWQQFHDTMKIEGHPVIITAGLQKEEVERVWHVGKGTLIGELLTATDSDRLWFSPEMEEEETVRGELLAFQHSQTELGTLTYSSRVGAHDDIICAIALALVGKSDKIDWDQMGRGIAQVQAGLYKGSRRPHGAYFSPKETADHKRDRRMDLGG